MTILKKIAAIRDELDVQKSGYDERNDYWYFKGEDVARAVRSGMVKHGVIHRTRIVEHTVENIIDKQGRIRPAAQGLYEIVFIDVDSGEEFPVHAVSSGSDIGGDKATRKMAVQAFKIASIDLFTVVEDMGKMDSDNYAEAPSLNEGAEDEPAANTGEPKLDGKALGARLGEMVRDPDMEHVTNDAILAVGRRIATEIMGDGTQDKAWRKDARVLDATVKALEKGEVG